MSITCNELVLRFIKYRKSFTIFWVAACHVASARAGALGTFQDARTPSCFAPAWSTCTRPPSRWADLPIAYFVVLLNCHPSHSLHIVRVVKDSVTNLLETKADGRHLVGTVSEHVSIVRNVVQFLVA